MFFCCCGSPALGCSPCDLPERDLVFTYKPSGGGTATTSFTLKYNSTYQRWSMGCYVYSDPLSGHQYGSPRPAADPDAPRPVGLVFGAFGPQSPIASGGHCTIEFGCGGNLTTNTASYALWLQTGDYVGSTWSAQGMMTLNFHPGGQYPALDGFNSVFTSACSPLFLSWTVTGTVSNSSSVVGTVTIVPA